jgi:asparagine synthase (glutamine-hydrolysing)
LSVIDLSAHAQQPMTDSTLGLTLVFNGCIYNYGEIRKQLETLGYRFLSDGDTEVVLKSFHAPGAGVSTGCSRSRFGSVTAGAAP